jgi:hypothetical protein
MREDVSQSANIENKEAAKQQENVKGEAVKVG